MVARRNDQILFKHLPQITGGRVLQLTNDLPIEELITDSRKVNKVENSLFFAISGLHHDSHNFIKDLHRLGCRQFVVEKVIDVSAYPDSSFLLVKSAIRALQLIVATHRDFFTLPVIGITGSNGKTIVKEWLYQLLSPDYAIVKNPGSYNSQLGVPLSVWQMGEGHNLGIFEAGISKPDEMKLLAEIIKPTIGVFTNLLAAHDEGFESRKQKASEKARLFAGCSTVVYCIDHLEIKQALKDQAPKGQKFFTWGLSVEADMVIEKVKYDQYAISSQGNKFNVQKNFSDAASWENLFHCMAAMLHLGIDPTVIQPRIAQLKALPMRLEMKEGLNGCTIIDDSYSNDLTGLKIALDFLQSQRKGKSVVILSDLLESGLKEADWIDQINALLVQHKIDNLIAVGPALASHTTRISIPNVSFSSVEEALKAFNTIDLHNSVILVKGARMFRLEQIAQRLQKKIHGTVMEINLGSLVHNLNVFRAQLKPTTKIMAMVKAFAYGSGSHEVASILQYHKVDYLGVAYADEGTLLRSHGIHLPIMVMNPTPGSFQTLIDFRLEPSVYSLNLLRALIDQIGSNEIFIHLKLDTGMHRLGFMEEDLEELIGLLKINQFIKIKSIYSHLAGSDDLEHDTFSKQQADQFTSMCSKISETLNHTPIRHILNSSGISRLGQYQFDMVRLGIGLYGVDPGDAISQLLKPAVTLRATISQIKTVKAGETIGYGRHGKSGRDMKLATLSIGYADGYSRAFSQGVGKVLVKDRLAPVVGNVCMDMTMVDISGSDAQEGDEVTIFGEKLMVTQVASWINTIPYELLTSTSDRVKRVFFAESI